MAWYKFVRSAAHFHVEMGAHKDDPNTVLPAFGYRDGIDFERLEPAMNAAIAEQISAGIPPEAIDILKDLPDLIRSSGALKPQQQTQQPETPAPAKKSNPILKLVDGSVTDKPADGGASVTSLSSFRRDKKPAKPTIVQSDSAPEPA